MFDQTYRLGLLRSIVKNAREIDITMKYKSLVNKIKWFLRKKKKGDRKRATMWQNSSRLKV